MPSEPHPDTLQPTVQTRIADLLRDALIRGHYKPGELLKIRDLALLYGTSMQPVREAIKQLVAEKALDALPNRSARVALLTRERLDDLTQVRIAVEGLAVALAAKRVNASEISELRGMLNEARHDPSDHMALHRDFHFKIYEISGSAAVLPIIESLWLQLGPYLRQATEASNGQGILGGQHHRALIDALERQDAKAAVRALELDVRQASRLFQDARTDRGLRRLAS